MRWLNTHLTRPENHIKSQKLTGNKALLGKVYLNDKAIDASQLMACLESEVSSFSDFKSMLKKFNGFYALIFGSSDVVYASVDHIRSTPLFYGIHEDQFFLSDDADWVRLKVGDSHISASSREEFQLIGFVSGNRTLFENVKQLQAGECLRVERIDGSVRIAVDRFYEFSHSEPAVSDPKILQASLDDCAIQSMYRLVEMAAGRQLVIPLSGGYDSRLIASHLKRLGYTNVVTFTYGTPGNIESQYSKAVARALSLEWHFVEYNQEKWTQFWASSDCWLYQKGAASFTSLAHVQDFIAVKELTERGIIDQDCIFVPGHSGDAVAGSHIPLDLLPDSVGSELAMCQQVFSTYYNHAPINGFCDLGIDYWVDQIRTSINKSDVRTGRDIADGLERWNWQERQSKFICNSVRVYEYFGYDWWMPQWDLAFVDFWKDVPFDMRIKQRLYIPYVAQEFSLVAGMPDIGHPSRGKSVLWVEKLRNLLRGSIFERPVKKLIFSLPGRHQKKLNNLGLMNSHHDFSTDSRLFNVNGILAFDLLRRIENSLMLTDDSKKSGHSGPQ